VPCNASWILWCATSQPTGHVITFWGAFRRGFGGWGDISLLVRDLLDTLVCEVESSLGAKGEVEPFLWEVVECIAQCNGFWGRWYHCPIVEGKFGACCLAPHGHLGCLA